MKKNHIQQMREEIAANPTGELAAEFAAIERKLRPACLKVAAWHDAVFPPESPTSTRRGGSKLALTPEEMDAVWAFIDAKMGHEFDLAQSDFDRAMKSADPKFFAMMAKAAQYVRDMPQARSTFAKHVIAARRIAASMMGESRPLPSKAAIKPLISEELNQEAYGTADSSKWSRVWDAAGLKDLPR